MGRFHANRFGGTKDLGHERRQSTRNFTQSRARLAQTQARRRNALQRNFPATIERMPPELRRAIDDIVKAMDDEYKLGRSILRQIETLRKWTQDNLSNASQQEIRDFETLGQQSVRDALDTGLIDQCTVQAVMTVVAPGPEVSTPGTSGRPPFPVGAFVVWVLVIYILVQRGFNRRAG